MLEDWKFSYPVGQKLSPIFLRRRVFRFKWTFFNKLVYSMKQAKGYVKCTDVYIMQVKDCPSTLHFRVSLICFVGIRWYMSNVLHFPLLFTVLNEMQWSRFIRQRYSFKVVVGTWNFNKQHLSCVNSLQGNACLGRKKSLLNYRFDNQSN